MRSLLILMLLLAGSPAWASTDVAAAHVRTSIASAKLATLAAEPRKTESNSLEQAAQREAAIGLALYREGEDFRAITALQRYRLLDGSPRAAHLSGLIVGHIYARNEKYRRARDSFERAAADAPDPAARRWSKLQAVQQSCIGLSLYFECRQIYDQLLADPSSDPRADEVTEYQSVFVDVVLRKPDIEAPRFENGNLAAGMDELMRRNRAFDELDLQSPWLAGTLSALVPGSGQFYNGAYLDGVIALGLTGGFGVATWYTFSELESIPGGVALGLVTFGLYLGNVINAVTDANRLNAQTYRTFFEKLQNDLWPRVSFVIDDERVLFGFSFATDSEAGEL